MMMILVALILGVAPAGELEPGTSFRDCADCPEMVVVAAGNYMMGSPESEAGRGSDEGPQRRVDIPKPFAVSRFEVSRAQYDAFLRVTSHPVSGNCITDRRKPGDWQPDPQTNLRDPGFAQADNHPVVCVNWNDARAYIAWLNSKTMGGYRLLSEAEWEYVARAGSNTAYPWGDKVSDGCAFMNGTDRTFRAKYPALTYVQDLRCDDGALKTAPVGSYRTNAFGFHDMIGNVGEWVEDCSAPSYQGLDSTSKPRTGTCAKRVVRSGSWGTIARQLRVAERLNYAPTDLDDSIGIRVAKTLP